MLADMEGEGEGEKGGLVLLAGAVKTEPTPEVPAWGALPHIVGNAGGPP